MKFPSLRSLLKGESVAASRLNPRLVDELMAERLLVPLPHGRRITYRAADVNQLKQYLIQKDERYRLLITDDTSVSEASWPLQRAELAAKTGNSKLQRVRSCPGFIPKSSLEKLYSIRQREIIHIVPYPLERFSRCHRPCQI